MRAVDRDTITAAFLATCGPTTPPRLRAVLESLVRHLHDFARETGLSHAEWRAGVEFLTRAGAISDATRNEFVLASDVLGLSSLVDMIGSPPEGTPSSVLGPFHILGAPELPVGGDLQRGRDGETVVVAGAVRDVRGAAVPGAALEIWQTAANGLYSNQDPAQAPFDFRARMRTGADGRYAFTTVRPAPYTVPTDGPVGDLLRATGRDAWRPSHFHFIVAAPGFRTLVTEAFPDDDPHLETDAVFGVREALVVRCVRHDDLAALPPGLAAAPAIRAPFSIVTFDMTLAAADA
jgi:protocatechuate 3,4-dioxygenase beta subunit